MTAFWCRPSSFNTQPPEGGWFRHGRQPEMPSGFNTQPPEGGWTAAEKAQTAALVSTHSRLKAAGCGFGNDPRPTRFVSTHSRLKAAGRNIS